MKKDIWSYVRNEAESKVDLSVKTDIQGYDVDPEVVAMARENARMAGVEHMIHFQKRGIDELSHHGKYGFIITNPPYGERLESDETVPAIYKTIGERFALLDTWSMYLITAYEDAPKQIGRKPDKNRKIYNGMMKTYLYQYLGPKPPKRKEANVL